MSKETPISSRIGKYLTFCRIPNWRCGVMTGQFRKDSKHKWYHVITGTAGLSDRQFPLDDGSGRTVYLEVKAPGKKQSQDQIDFEAMCVARNIPYFVAFSAYDVQDILELFGMCNKTVNQWMESAKNK